MIHFDSENKKAKKAIKKEIKNARLEILRKI